MYSLKNGLMLLKYVGPDLLQKKKVIKSWNKRNGHRRKIYPCKLKMNAERERFEVTQT